MKSATLGRHISPVEVTNVSPHGFWLFVGEQELFVSFKDFPWFRDAPVAGVLHVERPQPHHLYWPELDIDIDVQSILAPERFPLVSRERPNPRLQRAAGPRRAKTKPLPRRPRRR